MKEKLLTLTQKLTNAGFTIQGMEVEAKDIVRIKFVDLKGLQLVVNSTAAKIEEGNCPEKVLTKIKEILGTDFEIKETLESSEEDMFQSLLDAA
ncbi:MAG: hypothetical protein ACTSXO_10440 [Candidatus Heimdallarchaeota archaeon]|nr:MAG: hypothetical protein DRO63_01490 [Candidatus Gerdarchaeota archaeon]RLI71576.1 MAG: hypothetical protein DRP02_04310 [Candidatus Gerdarchaeota archaeon]RLI72303.1 MAG: hypothetical protein DRO91_04640 [Candidatus Heimdallarchaeota archaeon]